MQYTKDDTSTNLLMELP